MSLMSLALSRRTWAIAAALCLAGLATLIAPEGLVRPSPVHPAYPPTLSISGRVVDSRGGVPRNLAVVVSRESGFGRVSGSTEPLNEDGEFVARSLEPGTYVLHARRFVDPSGGRPGSEVGVTIVTLEDTDLTGVTITTRRGVSVRGMVRFEAEWAGAPTPRVVVHAMVPVREMAHSPIMSSGAAEDGTFVLNDLHGEVVFRFGWQLAPDGDRWWPRAVLLDGADITSVPTDFANRPDARLEVVFTQQFTGISGRVVDKAGRPVPGTIAVVFSTDPERWQGWATAFPPVDASGRFSVGRPPGNYLAVAFPAGAFPSSAAVLRHLQDLVPLATRVVVLDGTRTTVELEVRSLPPVQP